MATVKFYTRSSRKDILATVSVLFAEGRRKTEAGVNDRAFEIRVTTPLRMVPAYWDRKKQTIKKNIIYDKGEIIEGKKKIFTEPEALETVKRFEEIRKQIIVEYNNLKGKPTKAWLQSVIEKIIKRDTPAEENLNDYIYRFICEATAGKRKILVRRKTGTTKKLYSAGTLRNLRDFQRSFDHFQGYYKERYYSDSERLKKKKTIREPKNRTPKPLNWSDIDIDFYNEYVNYYQEKNCSDNYTGKHLKSFKSILRQAKKEGLPVNDFINNESFQVLSASTDDIYLTEEELQKLFNLDLSDKGQEHLKVARDVFLAGCYTAQRYSDYSRYNKEMIKTIKNHKYLSFNQLKTGNKVTIPLRPECDAILKEYDYTFPKTHETKINKYIKLVGQMAGIDEMTYLEKNKGGKSLHKKGPKYGFITTHCARRSGCTLMVEAGDAPINIRKISGHATEKEFLKYIKMTEDQVAVYMGNTSKFFQGNILKVV